MFELELASRGGAPLFRPFHILKALWHLQQLEPLGRKELSEHLSIGEGSARKLVSYLEEKDWASTTRAGIGLTTEGQALLNQIGFLASKTDAGDITVGENDFGIRLRGCAKLVAKGIEQRDEAMKVGASGATTLVFDGKLKFSDGFLASDSDGTASKALVEKFELQDGDLLIIGSSPNLNLAKDGAFAAAVVTLESKK
ncbi:MAG: hypothetical protein Q7J68_00495 [Thermoplasmata archaeon]|nr:hypothetical protein [Thermoplasmata archaeon]